jgi:predicted porin
MSASDLAAQMDSMPQVYGNVQIAYTYENSDENGDGNELFDNGSTIGLKHEHEIAPGVTGFAKLELQGIESTEKGEGNGLTDLDEAYIGIKGDSFGQVWVGSDDSRYEALLGDYANTIYEIATLNPSNSATTGEDDQIQYMSPSFGGLTLHAGLQINGESEGTKSYPYQLGGSYSMDTLTVSVVMDSNDGAASSENSYGLAVEYGMGALVLDAYFDMRGGDTSQDGNEQMGYMATYNMGANTFRVSYEMADADIGDASTDVIMFQALHNVSDNMYVYVEGGQRNIDSGSSDVETNQINVGSVYYF